MGEEAHRVRVFLGYSVESKSRMYHVDIAAVCLWLLSKKALSSPMQYSSVLASSHFNPVRLRTSQPFKLCHGTIWAQAQVTSTAQHQLHLLG